MISCGMKDFCKPRHESPRGPCVIHVAVGGDHTIITAHLQLQLLLLRSQALAQSFGKS